MKVNTNPVFNSEEVEDVVSNTIRDSSSGNNATGQYLVQRKNMEQLDLIEVFGFLIFLFVHLHSPKKNILNGISIPFQLSLDDKRIMDARNRSNGNLTNENNVNV